MYDEILRCGVVINERRLNELNDDLRRRLVELSSSSSLIETTLFDCSNEFRMKLDQIKHHLFVYILERRMSMCFGFPILEKKHNRSAVVATAGDNR